MAYLTKFHIWSKEQGGNNNKIVPPGVQYLYIAMNCIGLVERGRYDGGTMGEARDTNRIREHTTAGNSFSMWGKCYKRNQRCWQGNDVFRLFSVFEGLALVLHWCGENQHVEGLRRAQRAVEKSCSRNPLRTIFSSSSTSYNHFNPHPSPRARAVSHVAFPAVEKPHKRLAAVPPHPIYIILEEAFRLCVRNHNITLPRFCLSPHSLICMPLCQHYGSNHFSKSERFLYWGKSIIFEQSTQH